MNFKKSIASILAVMMIVGTFPMYAFAEDNMEGQTEITQEVTEAATEEVAEKAAPAEETKPAEEVKEEAPAVTEEVEPAKEEAEDDDFVVNADEDEDIVVSAKGDYEGEFRIEIFPKDDTGRQIWSSEYVMADKGETVTVEYPDVPGYHPIDGKTSHTFENVTGNASIDVEYAKNIYHIHCEYVDEQGNKILPDYDTDAMYGESLTIPHPEVPDLATDFAGEYVPKVTDNINRREVYKPCWYVTVKSVDQKGKKIAEDQVYSVYKGDSFFYSVPYIDGYVIFKDHLGIEHVDKSQDFYVEYGVSEYPVIIHYVDENGDEIRDADTYTVDLYGRLTYTCPEIPRYELKEGPVERTTEQITNYEEIYVEYQKTELDVTVHFTKDGEEFDRKGYTVKRGETLTYTCPKVKGYEPPYDSYTVTTDPIDIDREIIVDYSKKQYLVTVHYVDENGKKVAPDAVEQVEYMGGIEIDNPVVEGYKTKEDAISISNVEEDMEVSVVYTKVQNDDNDDNKKPNKPDTGDEDSLMLMLLMMMGAGAGLVAMRKREE